MHIIRLVGIGGKTLQFDSFEGRIYLAMLEAVKQASSLPDDKSMKNSQLESKDVSIANAQKMMDLIPERFSKAAAASEGALVSQGPISFGLARLGYDIRWLGSPPERTLRLISDCSSGTIEWEWVAHGRSTGCRVDAREFSEYLLLKLIVHLIENPLWQRGRFPLCSE
jgi:hypothetical protein